jgi:hypothetical protein
VLSDLDNYFLKQEEPFKSCLLFLRKHILSFDPEMTEAWKYGMPLYCYHGKMFCYLWVHKKYNKPYIGIVEGGRLEHPDLIMEKRNRMKILLVDPERNIPLQKINKILGSALAFYA